MPETISTLDDWLNYIEKLHAKPIDLGLDRMKEMIRRLGIGFDSPVITVAGTNGKGSTCTFIETIFREAGFRTALHTSPHLLSRSSAPSAKSRRPAPGCRSPILNSRGSAF